MNDILHINKMLFAILCVVLLLIFVFIFADAPSPAPANHAGHPVVSSKQKSHKAMVPFTYGKSSAWAGTQGAKAMLLEYPPQATKNESLYAEGTELGLESLIHMLAEGKK